MTVDMHRLQALALLIAVSANATWCVDGCSDPLRSPGATPSSAASPAGGSDCRSTCVMCVTPCQAIEAARLSPAWGPGTYLAVFASGDLPLPPRAGIEHPPRNP